MIQLRTILQEFQGKRLVVFDFDDTLARTDSYIYLTKADGTKVTLDPAEYAVYKQEPGDTFDYSDFNRMLRNPRIIKHNVDMMRAAMRNPQNRVTILTARALAFPIRYYFKTVHGFEPYVIGVGSSDPKKKSDWIAKHIRKGYTDVFFIDDSPKNVKAVSELQQEFPAARIKTVLAK
jgi:hypothetical protein